MILNQLKIKFNLKSPLKVMNQYSPRNQNLINKNPFAGQVTLTMIKLIQINAQCFKPMKKFTNTLNLMILVLNLEMEFFGAIFNILCTLVALNHSLINKQFGNTCGNSIKMMKLLKYKNQADKDRRWIIQYALSIIVTGRIKKKQVESICKTFVPNISEISIETMMIFRR